MSEADINLENILDAVIHAADEPLSVQRMLNLFEVGTAPDRQAIADALAALEKRYENSPLALVKIGQGYRYQTRAEFSPWITKLFETRPPKLSRALLETLAIIAYQQPVTRGDIQSVRGIAVSSDIMQRLMERGWVKKIGEKEAPGRPSLYATTPEFLSYFGLTSLKALPEIKAPRELEEIAKEMNLELPIEPLPAPEASGEEDEAHVGNADRLATAPEAE